MTPEPIAEQEMIGLCSPADKPEYRLALYLYRIEEAAEFRSTEMRNTGAGDLQYPPQNLYLYYLLTAYSTAELKSRSVDEHRILGRAMQVLYDNPILRGSLLGGTLAQKDEELRIVSHKMSMDELNKIWNFAGVSYRLSVGYKVGPVAIDSTRTKKTRRVMETEISVRGKKRNG